MARGLRIELIVPRAAVTPTMADRLGEDVEIKPCGAHDRVVFWVRSLRQNDAKQLRDVWRRALGEGGKEQLRSA
jgi:hypothetical protein